MTVFMLALAVFSYGAPSPGTKATELDGLVQISLEKGEVWTLGDPRASNLGYSGPQPARDFIVGNTSRDTQLASVLILTASGSPKEIVFSSTTVTKWEGTNPAAIDGYSYRLNLKGKLISVLRAHGKVGEVEQTKVRVTPAVKRRFESVKSTALTLLAGGKDK